MNIQCENCGRTFVNDTSAVHRECEQCRELSKHHGIINELRDEAQQNPLCFTPGVKFPSNVLRLVIQVPDTDHNRDEMARVRMLILALQPQFEGQSKIMKIEQVNIMGAYFDYTVVQEGKKKIDSPEKM